ncbi:Glucan endo-1,3-beta-glucosidase 11 [Capsicum baccatum]|uniref:Glucan endo-1,3-beta-glucosidase 11 n=1 Tax=Capsicum baccatum TaxID=33114 RepID=A0A2G2VDW4_CAPBA|nr:Glucan endo-1,3-beta-glucosidase 11 [Capsicum baccatum]
MVDPQQAQAWIEQHVQPYHTQTKITCITVGNEVLKGTDMQLKSYLLPAMQGVYMALINLGLDREIFVVYPHSAGILGNSFPPSSGSFRQVAYKSPAEQDTIMRQKVSKESPSSPKMIGEPLGTESKSNMNYASWNAVEKLESPKRCSNGKKCHAIDMSEGDVLIQDGSGKESGKPTVEVDMTNQGSDVTPCNRASKAKNWCLHFIKQGGVLKVALRMQLFFFSPAVFLSTILVKLGVLSLVGN